jgi:hypothetical protein
MNIQIASIAGTLLMLAMSAGAHAAEARPGQAGMDQIRRQTLHQLRDDLLSSLQPRLERDLIAANADAAPRHWIAAGASKPLPQPGDAAPY